MGNKRLSDCRKVLWLIGLCLIALTQVGCKQTPKSQFDRDYDSASGLAGQMLEESLTKQIGRCWKPPAKVRNKTKPYRITLKLRFSPNGTLSSPPIALPTHSGKLFKQTAQSAVEAVERCAPYELPRGARFPSSVILALNAGGAEPPIVVPRKRITDRRLGLEEQIVRCWNPPAGGTGTRGTKVRVKALFKPDGTIRSTPKILNKGDDALFPVAAESVQRAILRCAPYDLPTNFPGELILTFDTGEMFG